MTDVQLVRYDAACRAIAEAVAVDEAKHIRDVSEAMRAYARQAKNKQLEIDAAEIRIRAERRVGELMSAQRETVGLATAGRPRKEIGSTSDPISSRPATLAEAGIDKHLADRARKLAAVPQEQFDGMVGEWRERVEQENERVTTNLLRAGESELHRTEAKPKLGPPCNGMQFARIAIMKLEEIRDNDTEREPAFALVRRWLDARIA